LTYAIASGIKPVVKIVGKQLVRLVAVVRKNEVEPVTYLAEPGEANTALEAMPADYDETIRTESRTRIWRGGRWQHDETTTRTVRGN